jgi:phosphate butyryltransferase
LAVFFKKAPKVQSDKGCLLMINSFGQLLEFAKNQHAIKIAVAAANDLHVLGSLAQARKEGLAEAILVGNRQEIESTLFNAGISLDLFDYVHVDGGPAEQSRGAVKLVAAGKAQVLMKGLVDTSVLLKALLAEKKFRTERAMSIVGLLEVPTYPKLLLATDIGMNIEPDLSRKKELIENAVQVANVLGNKYPKVAVVCAKEKVDAKMQATLDAQTLVEMNKAGKLSGCMVSGPLALDNAISMQAAKTKGIDDAVAGDADILLVPDLVSGNILYKALVFLGGAKSGAVLVGAGVPVVVTSRADSVDSKIHSIAVASLLARKSFF